MFETIFISIAIAFGIDMTGANDVAVNAYNDLKVNNKTERALKQVARIENKLTMMDEKITKSERRMNEFNEISATDLERKNWKLFKKRIQYKAQLEKAQIKAGLKPATKLVINQ